MQMRHAGGTVVGVYVLASTGTARARSHTPRGSPLAHSIRFELYILYLCTWSRVGGISLNFAAERGVAGVLQRGVVRCLLLDCS